MVRVLDYSDSGIGRTDTSHPSSNISPALAVGERQHSTGKEVITAIVLGYELHATFNDAAMPPGPIWFDHGTINSFSVPLVAGKLLGLNEEQLTNAIGISGCHNIALLELEHGSLGYTGHMYQTKATRDAWPSASAVMGTLLAQKGYGGPITVIEGEWGFAKTYSNYDLEALIPTKERFNILSAVHIKAYNSAIPNMSRIEATLHLVKEHDIRVEDVEQVTVHTFNTPGQWERAKYHPVNRETADHSAPFAVAMAIRDRAVGVDQYSKHPWTDPRVLALMAKIRFVVDPDLEKRAREEGGERGSKVEIRTKDNKKYTHQVDHAKGSVNNPLTDEELEGKFRSMASKLLSEEQIQESLNTIRKLDRINDIGRLLELLIV